MEHATPQYSGRTRYAEEAARRYQIRDPRRHRKEMRMVERAFERVPAGAVLDIPCGGGRVSFLLARRGHKVTSADLSDAMLDIVRENSKEEGIAIDVQKQDVERLGFADRTFDGVVCFRLFHHFPTPELRARVMKELCRVAGSYVAVSYFSPLSANVFRRAIKRLFGKPVKKYVTRLSEVKRYARTEGFRFVADDAYLRGVHSLHLALFQRD